MKERGEERKKNEKSNWEEGTDKSRKEEKTKKEQKNKGKEMMGRKKREQGIRGERQ